MPLMTFTGIDAKTSTDWIKAMGRKYVGPHGTSSIQFAILRSPNKVGKSPRYPTAKEIRRITSYVYPQQLAFHLCGRYAEMVFSGSWEELADVVDFELVSRVQVNSIEADERAMIALQRFQVHIGKPVVMQWRGVHFPLVRGIELLQDRSGGPRH